MKGRVMAHATETPEPVVITMTKAAKLLSLSQATVARLIDEGEIPSAQVGKRRMVLTSYIRTVAEGSTPPEAESA